MTERPHLARLLTLETPIKSSDGAGGFHTAWNGLGRHWAEVLTRSARTHSGETSPLARSEYQITVRAAPVGSDTRPKPGQRFREGFRIYTINAVGETDQAGRYLTCFAHEEEVV